MRLKKGFTLAEILIVLMVIGVIATMTIPSLMKGVTEAQFKAGFKKAYNTVVNLTAMERVSGQLPASATESEANKMFASLVTNLSVKEYASAGVNSSATYASNQFYSRVTYTNGFGSQVTTSGTSTALAETKISATTPSNWIVTEDNMAYAVAIPSGGKCLTKAEINDTTLSSTSANAYTNACVVVVVDVNGLTKGPNRVDAQVANLSSSASMDTLTGDQYYIYVGSDGATSGPKTTTVSGRIVSDIK